MLDDPLQTRENRFFSWLAGYIIQVILIIQERTSENNLFRNNLQLYQSKKKPSKDLKN